MKKKSSKQIIVRVTTISLIANIILAILKAVVGFIFFNISVLSDSVHSVADVLTSMLVIVAVVISNPKPDKKHNYGHERFESLILLLFSFVLVGVGGFLVYQGIDGIISPSSADVHFMLIAVTVLAIVVKEAIFWFAMHFAKKLDSDIMKADAWHSRFDGLSSVAVLIGLVVSIFIGTNLAEGIAVVIVSLFIFKLAVETFIKAIGQLTDKSADAEVIEKIKAISIGIDGVLGVDEMRTRQFGNVIFVDISIAVDGQMSVSDSHDIAQVVHDTLESHKELKIKHCTVHINPFRNSD